MITSSFSYVNLFPGKLQIETLFFCLFSVSLPRDLGRYLLGGVQLCPLDVFAARASLAALLRPDDLQDTRPYTCVPVFLFGVHEGQTYNLQHVNIEHLLLRDVDCGDYP